MQDFEAQLQRAKLEHDARLAAMHKELLDKENHERAELETECKYALAAASCPQQYSQS